MKDERKAGFIDKLHTASRTRVAWTTALANAYNPLPGTGGATGVVAKYSSLGGTLRKFRPDLAGAANIAGAVKAHKPNDIQYLNKSIVDPANINSIAVLNGMAKHYNGGHAMKLIERRR